MSNSSAKISLENYVSTILLRDKYNYKYFMLAQFKVLGNYCSLIVIHIILLLLACSIFSISSGSERLELYVLSEQLRRNSVVSERTALRFNSEARRLGFEGLLSTSPSHKVPLISKTFFPIFEYSNNINSGNLNQTVQIGDYTFVGDEASSAKSGMLLGGGFLFGSKKFYGRGRYFDIHLKGSLAGAPKHDWLKVRNQSISICSKNHLTEWVFLDGCFDWGNNKRQFSDTTSKIAKTSLTSLFSMKQTFHEGKVGVERLMMDGYQQMQVSSNISSLFPNGVKTNLQLKFGQKIKDLIALNYSFNFSVTRRFNDQPLQLSMGQTSYDGGTFMSMPRDDLTRQVSISYPSYNGFTITAGYSDTSSSIDFFSHSSPYVYVSLPSWSF